MNTLFVLAFSSGNGNEQITRMIEFTPFLEELAMKMTSARLIRIQTQFVDSVFVVATTALIHASVNNDNFDKI